MIASEAKKHLLEFESIGHNKGDYDSTTQLVVSYLYRNLMFLGCIELLQCERQYPGYYRGFGYEIGMFSALMR